MCIGENDCQFCCALTRAKQLNLLTILNSNYKWKDKTGAEAITCTVPYSIAQATKDKISFSDIAITVANGGLDDSNNIKYTYFTKDTASTVTAKINGIDITTIESTAISFVYSKDGSTYMTLAQLLDGDIYLDAGTYFVKAVVAETNNWAEAESSPKNFTVVAISPTTGTADWQGSPFDNSSGTTLYYQNLLALNIGNTTVKYVDEARGISLDVAIKTAADTYSATINGKFKGPSTVYTVSVQSNDPNFTNFEFNTTVPLKVIAAIGGPVTQSYTDEEYEAENVAFGTIEAAVGKAVSGNTVWVVADNTGYVQIKTNVSVGSGVTLLLPYGAGSGDRNTGGKATIHFDGAHYYSKLTAGIISGTNGEAVFTRNTLVKIGTGVNLTIEAGATLEIAGEITGSAGGHKAGYTQGKYAELQLEGTASVEVNGTANITGFL